MTASNRAALLTKTHKVLKKHYEPVAPPSDRSVLEHLLYAACLENSKHVDVDDVFARLQQDYFDWNEVRVTTVAELAEVMAPLTDPADAARRLKSTLQAVFESHYSFDIDTLRKQNLGKAIKDIEKYKGVTPFGVAYVTQNALGGHAIPVNAGLIGAFEVIGVISSSEAAQRKIPGLERAINKSKGVEFASLVHQLGVDFAVNPHAGPARTVVLEIAPDAKDRMPKRGAKKQPEASAETPTSKVRKRPTKAAAEPPRKAKKSTAKGPAAAASTSAKKKSPTKRLSRKKPR